MDNLKILIDHFNVTRKTFKEALVDINNIDDATANHLFHDIEIMLQPENLHQDGERSVSAAIRVRAVYIGGAKELKSKGFDIPGSCYELLSETEDEHNEHGPIR